MLDIVTKAKHYASIKHSGQMYNDQKPYTWHLDQVVDILIGFNYSHPVLLNAAALHDICECTGCSYSDIKKNFGEEVAEIVYLVTDEKGRNRKERHEKTYPILATNEHAVVVKLADRIANVTAGFSDAKGKVKMYKEEYKYFRDTLYNSTHEPRTQAMWIYLDQLMK